MSKRALGKGLDALIQNPDVVSATAAVDGGRQQTLPLERIMAATDQPRKHFDDEKLQELAESIRHQGIIQPLVVEPRGERYLIVAGERRYRAAKLAGLKEVPVVVARYGEKKRLLVSLIENLQREDLDPIEEAQAYRTLMKETNFTQEIVAKEIGKSRATVANTLRLLTLSVPIQDAIRNGEISAGHAKALLSIPEVSEREKAFIRIMRDGLSVREAEELARQLSGATRGGASGKAEKTEQTSSPEVQRIEQQFIEALGTKVRLKGSLSKGTLEVSYFSQDDLQRLYELFVK